VVPWCIVLSHFWALPCRGYSHKGGDVSPMKTGYFSKEGCSFLKYEFGFMKLNVASFLTTEKQLH
jgi:hypothetical protein